MRDAFVGALSGRYRIRPFSASDLHTVLQVEADCFTFPWSKSMFLAELHQEDVSRCFVAEICPRGPVLDRSHDAPEGSAVVAYIMSWLILDELHITNLAVSPSHRRSGLATVLVERVLEDAKTSGATWCQLEVRVDNNPARALYGKFGFREIGVRKGYYQDGEDALVLGKELEA